MYANATPFLSRVFALHTAENVWYSLEGYDDQGSGEKRNRAYHRRQGSNGHEGKQKYIGTNDKGRHKSKKRSRGYYLAEQIDLTVRTYYRA